MIAHELGLPRLANRLRPCWRAADAACPCAVPRVDSDGLCLDPGNRRRWCPLVFVRGQKPHRGVDRCGRCEVEVDCSRTRCRAHDRIRLVDVPPAGIRRRSGLRPVTCEQCSAGDETGAIERRRAATSTNHQRNHPSHAYTVSMVRVAHNCRKTLQLTSELFDSARHDVHPGIYPTQGVPQAVKVSLCRVPTPREHADHRRNGAGYHQAPDSHHIEIVARTMISHNCRRLLHQDTQRSRRGGAS